MYQPLSQSWLDVFNRDTEQETFTYVIIDGVRYDDGPNGRLDAVRPSVPADSFIGGFNMLAYEIDIYIQDIGIDVSSWIGKTVEIFEGYEGTEFISKGVFTVDADGVDIDDNLTTAKIYCVDNAYKFDVKIEPLTFPATGSAIVDEICARLELTRDGAKNLHFDDFEFNQINVNEGQDISYRQIVNHYAQINGVMAVINRSGNLQFIDVIHSAPSGVIVDGLNYEKIKVQPKVGPINSLKVTRSDATGDEDIDSITITDQASADANGITQVRISNNVFIDLFPEDVIEEIFSLIKDYEYHPITVENWYPHFELDQGDIITVKDLDDNEYTIPYMAYSWSYGGGINGKFETIALPETLPDYTLEGINQRIQTTEFKVDKVANQITGLAQTQETINNTLDEQIGKWTLTDSMLQQEIIDRQTEDERIMTEASSLVTQTAEAFTLEFTRVDGSINEVTGDMNELKMTYQLTADGALIGKNDDPFQLSFSNKELDFLENGSIVAYINGQKMYIESLEVLKSIILGYHQIEKYDGAKRGTLVRMSGG